MRLSPFTNPVTRPMTAWRPGAGWKRPLTSLSLRSTRTLSSATDAATSTRTSTSPPVTRSLRVESVVIAKSRLPSGRCAFSSRNRGSSLAAPAGGAKPPGPSVAASRIERPQRYVRHTSVRVRMCPPSAASAGQDPREGDTARQLNILDHTNSVPVWIAPAPPARVSFDRDALREVARLVGIVAAQQRQVVAEQLGGGRVEDGGRRAEVGHPHVVVGRLLRRPRHGDQHCGARLH